MEPLISQRTKFSRFGRAIDNAYLVQLSAPSQAPIALAYAATTDRYKSGHASGNISEKADHLERV
jgi:hypothetical protein